MDVLNVSQTRDMILYVADKVIESKPLLTEVDSKIGDGDHGIGMSVGFKKVKEVLAQKEVKTINALFKETGIAMLNSMGGASGVIFSTIFLGGIKNTPETDQLDVNIFADMMEKALQTIKERGKADIGDKTMIDAFQPAAAALRISAGKSESFKQALAGAEYAAAQGVENTKNYVAKFGRAKSLLERAMGFQDAGATSVWIIFKSMREWAEQNLQL